jgi:hypothetical protein
MTGEQTRSTGDAAYLGDGHWIEFCNAAGGRRDGHIDIPLRDLAPIVVEVLRRDLLSMAEAWLVLEAAEESLSRRAKAPALLEKIG